MKVMGSYSKKAAKLVSIITVALVLALFSITVSAVEDVQNGFITAEASVTIGNETEDYSTLGAAIEAVKNCKTSDNATVKLLKNVSFVDDSLKITAEQNEFGVFTFDLNGYEIIREDKRNVIDLSGFCQVTFIDSVGEGKIVGGISLCDSSKAEIVSGTITGDYSAIYATEESTVLISGGSICGLLGDIEVFGDSVTVSLTVDEYGEGATFPGGVSVSSPTLYKRYLNDLLAADMAYWQGDKMLAVAADTIHITGYDVIVKAECKHGDEIAFEYTVDNNTITKTCLDCKMAGTASISADSMTYNGFPLEVTLEKTGLLEKENIEITYTKDGKDFYGDIVNAGNYTAAIVVGNKPLVVQFSIQKAYPTFMAPVPNNLIYDGSEQELLVAGTVVGGTMIFVKDEDSDMTDSIPTAVNAGEYTVYYKVEGENENYNDSEIYSITVTIQPRDISLNGGFSLSESRTDYNGQEKKPSIENTQGLVENVDYKLVYYRDGEKTDDLVNVGDVEVHIVGINNYTGSIIRRLSILQRDITNMIYLTEDTVTFNGTEQKPVLSDLNSFNPDTDYTVIYTRDGEETTDFINAGTIAVTVTGKGNYSGTTSFEFIIKKAAAPEIIFPTAIGATYGDILSSVALRGGSVEYGSFDWVDGTLLPTVNNSGYSVVFNPSESTCQNYETIAVTEQTVAVNVAKKEITVTAENVSVCVDDTCIFTYRVSGLIDNHTFDTEPTITVNTDMKTAGEYEIVISGGVISDNYSIIYVNGMLTVRDHSWNDGLVIKTPACDKKGEKLFTCLNNGLHTKIEEIIINPNGIHEFGNWHKYNEEMHEKECEICGYLMYIGHSWDEGEIIKHPTCKDEGEQTFVCTECGETVNRVVWVDGNAHAWDEGTVTKAPTYTEPGIKTYICQYDSSHVKTEDIPALESESTETNEPEINETETNETDISESETAESEKTESETVESAVIESETVESEVIESETKAPNTDIPITEPPETDAHITDAPETDGEDEDEDDTGCRGTVSGVTMVFSLVLALAFVTTEKKKND